MTKQRIPTSLADMPMHVASRLRTLYAMPKGDDPDVRLVVEFNALEPLFRSTLFAALQDAGYATVTESQMDMQRIYHNPAALHAAYKIVSTYVQQAIERAKLSPQPDPDTRSVPPHPMAMLQAQADLIASVMGYQPKGQVSSSESQLSGTITPLDPNKGKG